MAFTPSIYQEAIFRHFRNPDGHKIVNARAGSGKSTTLIEGSKLLPSSQRARSLFAAFNSSIVKELQSRLPNDINCQTIHSLGYQALRSGLKGVKKWDVENGKNKYRQAARDFQMPSTMDRRPVEDCLQSLVNFAQLSLTPLNPASIQAMAYRFNVEIPPSITLEQAADAVVQILERGKEQAEGGLISFTDMLYMPSIFGLRPIRYSQVLLDEAQDLSKVQMHLLEQAVDNGGIVTAVADPNQAIYGFAGAESDSFQQLKSHFGMDELPLSICYRCPTSVIKLAQTIVPAIEAAPNAKEGKVAHIPDEKFHGMLKPGDMVLCRVTAPLIKLCFQLIAKRISAKVKGRDIGVQLGNTIRSIMGKRNADISSFPDRCDEWQQKQIARLEGKFAEDQIESIRDKGECLMICFDTFEPRNIEDFTNAVANLFSDQQAAITLSTVHRAKGLENPRVFIILPEKLPLVWKGQKQNQYEQEMNLKYVAVTRAQEELYFVDSPGKEVSIIAEKKGTTSESSRPDNGVQSFADGAGAQQALFPSERSDG